MTIKESVTIIFDDGTISNQNIDIEDIPKMVDLGMTILKIQNGEIVYANVDQISYEFLGFKLPEMEQK